MSLTSLMLGDCDHYASPYMRGVAQAMAILNVHHRQVSIRQPIGALRAALDESKPDILWTHMLLWPPAGSPAVAELVALMQRAHDRGAHIVVHDGDYKERTRHPHDLSSWCDLALTNHAFDRSAWCVPTMRWPYFAQWQDRMAEPDPAWRCGLFFAGTLGAGPVYSERTALVERVRQLGVDLKLPKPGDNTLDRTATIATAADAVLGFGRPGVSGWVDVRVFQYSGAGGILIHDDVAGYLQPLVHYVPYDSGRAESVVEALARLRALPESDRQAMRTRAFSHVHAHHSSVARVRQVLGALEIRP